MDLGNLQDSNKDTQNFYVGKGLADGDKGQSGVKWDNVQDLFDEDGVFEEMKQEGNILFDQNENDDKQPAGAVENDGGETQKKRKQKAKSQREIERIEEENFAKEY